MEREAPISFWMPPARFAFLNKSLGTFLDRKACLKLLDAPLASLAALARSLRSPHRGEFLLIFHWFFNLFLILEIVSISIDLNWIFMPTWLHVGLILRLLVHLGASRARLGASWHVLGRLGGVLAASWGVLGRSWGVLGASWVVLSRLRGVLEASWVPLGSSWGVLEASWAPLGSSWRRLGRLLTRLGSVLGASWNRLGSLLNSSST